MSVTCKGPMLGIFEKRLSDRHRNKQPDQTPESYAVTCTVSVATHPPEKAFFVDRVPCCLEHSDQVLHVTYKTVIWHYLQEESESHQRNWHLHVCQYKNGTPLGSLTGLKAKPSYLSFPLFYLCFQLFLSLGLAGQLSTHLVKLVLKCSLFHSCSSIVCYFWGRVIRDSWAK